MHSICSKLEEYLPQTERALGSRRNEYFYLTVGSHSSASECCIE